jgi:hypothetical protein
VYGPDGNLYRSMSVPITTDESRSSERVKIRGYPRAMPVQVVTQTGRGGQKELAAELRLPVAGTDIVSRGLYGSWTVRGHLDYDEDSCTPPAPFVIRP